MTYIRTANGLVKSNITVSAEYERNLLEPVENPKPYKSGWKKGEIERAMRIKPSDPTAELSYLDERMQPSFHTYLEEMWEEEQGRPPQKSEEEPRRRKDRFAPRPYIGCPDCPRWDWYKGCRKQFENTKLCEEIDERYREKGE